jgi:hypothetical protein
MTQFSDTITNTGLIQKCEFNLFGDKGYGRISGDTDKLQAFTGLINDGYKSYTNIVMNIDGSWQIDDSNYTDYAIATTAIVAGQADYPFSANFIQILSIEIQTPDGTWIPLDEVDETQFPQRHESMTNMYSVSGIPTAFNRTANSLFLLSTPNYSLSGGIKVKYQRPNSLFVYGDTGKEPGFSPTHHEYLSDYACDKYAGVRSMSNANTFANRVQKWELVTIPALYQRREKDIAKRIIPRYQNNK